MNYGATRKFSTTPGTRDILPPEATRLRELQSVVRERFGMFGFQEVITPALEYSEVIEEPNLRDAAFKLFDRENQMLILRPEMTTPIARLVAQRLGNSPPPHKLSYVLSAYRRASVGRGQSAELYQAGVEVVGSASPAEDAATIALLADVLEAAGLEAGAFAVALGQTAFYEGYLRHAAPDAAHEVLEALAAKDLVRVDEVSSGLPAGVAAAVRELPRLVGPATDGSLLERAAAYASGIGEAEAALENLREILRHLEAHGTLENVILDLGLIGRRNYYTGAVFEVYAGGMGFTVANGGRYDNLLRRFGESLPATGFAISLERLLHVLPEREEGSLLLLVGGGVEGTRLAGKLRLSGVPVLHLAEDPGREAAAAYARATGAFRMAFPVPDGVELVPVDAPETGETLPPEAVAGKVLG
ncbi:MAG: ATP phosphoribosyltransferase regulatory subunit [Rubrobacter sp.]|nr:ATP phosphoribosyltransferase regulatory subunit [Rubrobacter sp.]